MVEDDPNNRQLFREVFESSDFDMLIINNSDGDFVNSVLGFAPDVISMDLMLGKPGGGESERDGFEAIELLKNDDRTKDIPVFILTHFFEESKVKKAKEFGVVDFISLQGQSTKNIPEIFLRYLKNPKKYLPTHPLLRNT